MCKIPMPEKDFDYKLKEPIEIGSRVLVPFGNRYIEVRSTDATELLTDYYREIEG